MFLLCYSHPFPARLEILKPKSNPERKKKKKKKKKMMMMMKKKNVDDEGVVHVAILPSPGTGHIIPHLEFAKRLVTLHDFKVTFLILSTETSITQTQILLQSQFLPPNLHILHLPPIDISPFLNITQIQTRISIIIRESLPHIHSSLDPSHLPDILVVDFFATDTFQIADKLGIPKFIFFTSPAELLAFLMYLPTLDRDIIIDDGEFVHLPEPLLRVPGCNPIRIQDLPEVTLNRKSDGYKWFLHHASRFPLADGILVNTCQDLEPNTLKSLGEDPILRQIPTPRVYPVGPIIKTADHSSSSVIVNKPGWMTWLDLQPSSSVLFVSFGSGGTLTEKQLTELAWGLELSQQRFIWVVRRPIQTETTMRKFLSVGVEHDDPSMYLPDGFLDRIQGRGFVVPSWVPQVQILSHRSTGGFLSHCGWNSSLESMYYGVPMIAWPLYAEQKMNATMLIEEIGVAVRGKIVRENDGGLVGREEIERVVRLVMEQLEGREEEEEEEEGKGLRRRAAQVREKVVRAVKEADGSSCISLNELAKEWKASVFK